MGSKPSHLGLFFGKSSVYWKNEKSRGLTLLLPPTIPAKITLKKY
jgi:hypothetical protein